MRDERTRRQKIEDMAARGTPAERATARRLLGRLPPDPIPWTAPRASGTYTSEGSDIPLPPPPRVEQRPQTDQRRGPNLWPIVGATVVAYYALGMQAAIVTAVIGVLVTSLRN